MAAIISRSELRRFGHSRGGEASCAARKAFAKVVAPKVVVELADDATDSIVVGQ